MSISRIALKVSADASLRVTACQNLKPDATSRGNGSFANVFSAISRSSFRIHSPIGMLNPIFALFETGYQRIL